MIKFLTAFTKEIDDPEAAVADILGQIDIDSGLLAHSVGIVSCYYEFVETGVVAALAERLPFDVIGCTAMGSGVNARCSLEQLSLLVLSSDDVNFACSLSGPLDKDNIKEQVTGAYTEGRKLLSANPALIFTLGPIMTDAQAGEDIVDALNNVSGNVPLFGTLSNDTDLSYKNAKTFFNGEIHQYRAALLLIQGNINPRFFVTGISDKNIQRQKGEITSSDGCFLKEVNNMPLLNYLATLGIRKENLGAFTSVPIIVDYGDGTTPVALSMYSVNETGALCGGKMPVGASVAIAEVDYSSVMTTAEDTVKKALAEKDISGIIAIPCFSRILVISPRAEDEMKKTRELIGQDIPFFLCYSGGEICPTYNEKGESFNRFHNLTYTLAVF
ncbi:MAG: FIST C-terminal domain-containing protein [Treponema sp.]|nr:FIST C-terminal domain-containing protein [Treponema sp.]